MTRARANELDLLRFLAALAVVLFHYTFRGHAADGLSIMPYPALAPYSKYGYLGVELFFMISGFVILMTASKGSLRRFFISRASRLYPAFWACCSISFITILAFGDPRFSASTQQYLLNMTMMNGFIGVPSIDGVYWSLFVEIKFYLLVSVILAIGRIHQAEMFLAWWLLASAVLTIFPVGKLNSLLLVDYSSFFIAGATFFMIWSDGENPKRWAMIFFSWILALLIALNELSDFEKHYGTAISGYVVTMVISAFFLIMYVISTRRTRNFATLRWSLAGAVSYPLYLLHQNIGYITFNKLYPQTNSHLLLWGAVAVVLVAALVVHLLVERRLAPQMKTMMENLLAVPRKPLKKPL